jgi:hypothetical protein
MRLISITKATDGKHKYQAHFDIDGKKKTVKFGSVGYESFPQHKDVLRKESYLVRHRPREDWNDPTTSGALSRWILWNLPSLKLSIKDFIRRFKL